jgi:hypothetical protein
MAAQNKDFSFATTILGDDQFSSSDTQALLIDVRSDALPEELRVQASVNWFVPGGIDYVTTSTQPVAGENGWSTIRIEPQDLKSTLPDHKPMESWAGVKMLSLTGKGPEDEKRRTVFKNLRWEEK